MSDLAIKIENLSKQYRLGLVGTGTLSHDLNRWWHLARGKEDPYLRIGDLNDRTQERSSDYVWALKGINLQVSRGEVIGVIGRNGAGKSTLLKLLSKVTSPTLGKVTYRGRIGSLLEVGTGFHDELTGMENIFLNGAILGMTRLEIRSKLDAIIAFSGVERYIDTPVKRYSSGMMVRLGFAVAAHLDPEILVVDEVLAVGDAEFQRKAVGKMQDVSRYEGRTVLFVSHNLNSIKQLCSRTVLLDNGVLLTDGATSGVVEEYLSINDPTKSKRLGTRQVYFDDYFLESPTIELADELIVKFKLRFAEPVSKASISLDITHEDSNFVAHINNEDDGFYVDQKIGTAEIVPVEVVIRSVNLAPGTYHISLWIGDNYGQWFDYIENCMKFSVEQGTKLIKRPYPYDNRSKVVLPSEWRIQE